MQLNDALKKLHQTAFELNAVISLKYVPSSANPADPPYRVLSDLDCMLSRKAWQELEKGLVLTLSTSCPWIRTPRLIVKA